MPEQSDRHGRLVSGDRITGSISRARRCSCTRSSRASRSCRTARARAPARRRCRRMRTSPGLEDIWQLHWSYGAGIEQNSAGVFIANVDDNATIAGILTAPPRGGGPGEGGPRCRVVRRRAGPASRAGRWFRRPAPPAGRATAGAGAPQQERRRRRRRRRTRGARRRIRRPTTSRYLPGLTGRSRSPTAATDSRRRMPHARGHGSAAVTGDGSGGAKSLVQLRSHHESLESACIAHRCRRGEPGHDRSRAAAAAAGAPAGEPPLPRPRAADAVLRRCLMCRR